MILRELIQRSVDIAVQGLDSPVLRTSVELAVEPLLPVVFGRLSVELATNPATRHLLRRAKTVVLVAGVGPLGDDVLTEYATDAVLLDQADIAKIYSLVAWDVLGRGELDSRLGHFIIDGQSLTVVEPGSEYDPNTGPDTELTLIIPCSLAVPALDADIGEPAEVTDMLIARLAAALKPVVVKSR
jgi:hypothetical protein